MSEVHLIAAKKKKLIIINFMSDFRCWLQSKKFKILDRNIKKKSPKGGVTNLSWMVKVELWAEYKYINMFKKDKKK